MAGVVFMIKWLCNSFYMGKSKGKSRSGGLKQLAHTLAQVKFLPPRSIISGCRFFPKEMLVQMALVT